MPKILCETFHSNLSLQEAGVAIMLQRQQQIGRVCTCHTCRKSLHKYLQFQLFQPFGHQTSFQEQLGYQIFLFVPSFKNTSCKYQRVIFLELTHCFSRPLHIQKRPKLFEKYMQIGLASLDVRGLSSGVKGLDSNTIAQHGYEILAFCLNRKSQPCKL